MYKSFSMELAGRTLTVDVNRVAKQANGAAFMHYGDTTVLSTATASDKPRDGIDFFPLSIDYEERLYSVGKIPGGFIKREGRPSEKAILTSRCIDRPIRPLFPKDYRNDVAVVATVMSVDQDCQPEVAALWGASIALSISDIPFTDPVGSVNIGLVDGELVVNPDSAQREASKLALTVVSKKDKVMMIEAGASEVPNDLMMKAIRLAHEENVKIVEFIDTIVEAEGLEKQKYEEYAVNEDVYNLISEYITTERMEKAVFAEKKQERDIKLNEITEEVVSSLSEKIAEILGDEEKVNQEINDCIYKFEKMTVRHMILRDHRRPDGRQLEEIRPLSAEVDILPRTHGSALFKRGQTQVLTVTTIGSIAEAQKIDGLDANETTKRYMHHYNFPSFSVGETKPSRGPGRREIGHGALAERALVPVLPSEEEFPYAIRTVSETMESNGSTSQASICASTLSLMAAGVPIKRMVAGISCGLVTGETDDDYIVLTDIQGLEDFFGDMDFKVGGTEKGITAIQMDIKIHGLTRPIIEEAIARTREARMYILDNVMKPVISEPRKHLSQYAPKIKQITIDPQKIGDVVGKQGKVINKIIEETGVKIDISDDGIVNVCGTDEAMIDRAIAIITGIVTDIEAGMVFTGKVVRIMNFGAFVQLAPNKDGMVHISKLSDKRVAKVEDVVNIGDEVTVKVAEVDKMGRINLTMRPSDLAEKKEEKEEN